MGRGRQTIAHVCNDIGGWGRRFVLGLSRRWPEPEEAYRARHRDRRTNDFGPGAVQLVRVQPDVWVANMIGQRGIRWGGRLPVRYEAIDTALGALAGKAVALGASAAHRVRAGGRHLGPGGAARRRAAREAGEIRVTVYDHDA